MKNIITLTAFLFLTVQIFAENQKYVNSEALNIREGAGVQYDVVGKLTRGDEVNVIIEKGNWTQIEAQNGIKGYVSTKYLTSSDDKGEKSKLDKSFWISLLTVVGLLGYAAYKIINFLSGLFGSGSSNSNSSSKPDKREKVEQTDIFHLSVKDGVVYLGKERSSMQMPAFSYSTMKAIDCDLEDQADERSRFLVVTIKGEVILCRLKSTEKKVVYGPNGSKGSAYKASFFNSESFVFQTEEGSYKGYFKSSQKDKLS